MAQSKKYTIQHRISGIVFSLLKCKLHPCIFFVYCLELELPGGLYGNIEHFQHLACLQIFYPVLLACSGKISKRHCNLPSKILLRNLISSHLTKQPSILQTSIQKPCKYRPPPLFFSDGNSVCIDILIHAISPSHSQIVFTNSLRCWNIFIFFSVFSTTFLSLTVGLFQILRKLGLPRHCPTTVSA